MDWLTFSIRLIEALAWPVTLAALIIVFARRPEIRALVPLLRKLKAGPLEAEFDREIRKISEETGEVTTPEIEVKPDQRLVEMAKLYPRTAILEAWVGIEATIKRAARQILNVDISNSAEAFNQLIRIKAVSPSDVALALELRRLRDQAASHAEEFEPSRDAALQYVKLASQLEASLRRLGEPR
jgi:hypothetical protein